MTPEELLLEAADNIAKYGHYKGDFGSPEKGFCALGAIQYALTGSVGMSLLMTPHWGWYNNAASLLARSNSAIRDGCIPPWNDAPETTGEDVILAMKRAAHHE